MKRTHLSVLAIVLGLIVIGLFWWRTASRTPLQRSDSNIESAGGFSVGSHAASTTVVSTSGNAALPKLFKSMRYPPETADEKAMWDWWNQMVKTEPDFEWKMPIEFYGKVIDQFGEPVVGATVVFRWTTVGGGKEVRKTTDLAGQFELAGENGKRLTIDILKAGYLPSRQWPQGFEYAEFFNEMFHAPDTAHPVVFKMHKLLGAEPFYVFPFYGKAKLDGSPLHLNPEKGTFEPVGEISFTVSLGTEKTKSNQAYTVIVQSNNGALIAPTDEEFPFLAPAEGYQAAITIVQRADDPNYQTQKNLKLYTRLSGGRFAFVGVEVKVIQGRDAVISGAVRYNEKWSRNLEFDHRKWLNR